jgi:CelD/BcsL family acetyltransferase involved in cellulose biosynthesis
MNEGVTASLVENPEKLQQLGREWEHLADHFPGVTPFLRFKWLAIWWAHWGQGHRLLVIPVRDGTGRLVALAPFYISTDSWAKLGARRIRFLGDMHAGSDYLSPLVEPGFERSAGRAITALLVAHRSRWDYLHLDHAADSHPAMLALRAALAEAGYQERLERRSLCPYAALPRSFDDYLGMVGPNLRYNFRRRFKALHREGSVTFVTVHAGTEIQARFPELVRLHALRFASQGKTSSFLRPDVQRFHHALIAQAGPADGLRLFALEVKGRTVAALYGFSSGSKFLFFQSGMDPLWSRYSVGLVLMGCALEQAIKDGHREFDFLRGDEAYKYQWATGVRNTSTVSIFGGHARARWVQACDMARHWMHVLKRSFAGRRSGPNAIPGEARRAHAIATPPA